MPRQREITIVPATALGGSTANKGNFVLADLPTVSTPQFWDDHPNIGLIVNCIGQRHGSARAVYPRRGGQPLVLFIETHNHKTLPGAFATAAGVVEPMLRKGKDILVHCRETFHRGPGICAGMFQKIQGVHYKVLYRIVLAFRSGCDARPPCMMAFGPD